MNVPSIDFCAMVEPAVIHQGAIRVNAQMDTSLIFQAYSAEVGDEPQAGIK